MNRKTHEKFVAEMAEKFPTIKVLGKYIDSRIKVHVKCECCGRVWSVTPNSILRGQGCVVCHNGQDVVDRIISYEELTEKVYLSKRKPDMGMRLTTQHDDFLKDFKFISNKKRLNVFGNPTINLVFMKKHETKRIKSHEEFMEEFTVKGKPDIEILGKYELMGRPIEVMCKRCNHVWYPKANSLLYGKGCPVCANKVISEKSRKSHEEFLSDLYAAHGDTIEVLGQYAGSDKRIRVKCSTCGNVWNPTAHGLLSGSGCPVCCRTETSYVEQVIAYVFKMIYGNDNVSSRDKSVIGKELDVYIPELSFAVEYGSWHWHEKRLSSDIEKHRICHNKNIRLITVYDACSKGGCFQDEFFQNKNVWVYEEFLGDRKNDDMLRVLILRLLAAVNVDYSISDSEWSDITKKAKLLSRKRTPEGYQKELAAVTDKIICLDEYIDTSTKILHQCTVCGYEWSVRPSAVLRGHGCPKCASHARKTTERYQKELAAVTDKVICLDEYVKSGVKILHRCTICGHEWLITPSNTLQGHGCPKCAGHKLKTTEEYVKDLAAVTDTVVCLGEYVGSKTKIWHRCTVCGNEWLATPNTMLSRYGCPKCARNTIKKMVRCVETGIVYSSIKEATEAVGLSSSSVICRALRLGVKSGGYSWEYVDCV